MALAKGGDARVSVPDDPQRTALDAWTVEIDRLRREKNAVWSGVNNPAAVKNLREMKPGDALVIYHTGGGDGDGGFGGCDRPQNAARENQGGRRAQTFIK